MEANEGTGEPASKRRRLLDDLANAVESELSALEAAAHAHLDTLTAGGASQPELVKLCVTISPHQNGRPETDTTMDCWTVSEPCGKSSSGYIYCEKQICMIVGPVTLSE